LPKQYKSLSVVIPSRTQPKQVEFLRRAIASIKGQSVSMPLDIIVALDPGAAPPVMEPAVTFVFAQRPSQAGALNAGLTKASSDLLAFLEDDDEWHPQFLHFALQGLTAAGFVSSTQLEVNERDEILSINDFPTPSGWLMPMTTALTVGKFDESFRWHLDNEWLGRLGDSGIPRLHLVEATAPVNYQRSKAVRPWLAGVVEQGGPASRIVRHNLLVPLVRRLVHSQSGMAQVLGQQSAESDEERQRLISRFGRIPW